MDLLELDSDIEAYTETSDSEDQEDSESSYGGHAQSILSSLDESIGKIDDFLAFERGFTQGDIVCSVADPSGQLGRVLDVDMIVELETICGQLITNVNSKKLLRVRSIASGDYVVQGPWLGRVEKVIDVVTVLFNDGSKSEILVRDAEVLTPVSPSFEDAPYPYYPGQRVKVKTVPKSATWLCGPWRRDQDEGTVCHVEVGLVYVNWIVSVMLGQASHPPTPPYFQDPKGLTLLSCFSYANWQLGDWCTLPVDYFINLPITAEKSSSAIISSNCFMKMQEKMEMNRQHMYMIVKTRSKVDVLWQSGEMSVGLGPQSLSPVNNISDHDFWPHQFVLEKVSSEDMNASRVQRLGIVKNVDSHERTVIVKWITSDLNTNGFTEETVSAYELLEHPDFSYCTGDVILRYLPGIVNMNEGLPHAQIKGQQYKHDICTAISSSFPWKDALDKHIDETCIKDAQSYLSCIGNFIGYEGEHIKVRWANGLLSTVLPFQIIGLDRLLDSAPMPSANEEIIPANVSKEIADQAKQLSNKKEKKVANETNDDCMKDVWRASALFFPRAAFGFLTYIAASLFSSLGSTSVSGSNKEEYQNLKTEELSLNTDILPPENLKQQVEEIIETGEPTAVPKDDKLRKFKKFDIVSDYSDNYFLNGTGNQLMLSQVGRGWLKKVQQEWNILKSDLPDFIYVRVYEERMDLLRASIVGAPGTPYHDGLFFFDIFLPSDYPREPPVVHYYSGGLRLNPNLYESGKVCLSLLKTWMGTGSEVWNPGSSTILQVLLSLQALVLNEKPYFNEAGYDEQVGKVEGEKNSITYNENAFIQSCKSMMYILRRPPKHFEALVEEHFTQRSHHILSACKAYLGGARVGHPYDCEEVSGEGKGHCSTGFKIMLAKLLPKLVSALSEMGIDCSQYVDSVNK